MAGETVTIGLTLPDGTETAITSPRRTRPASRARSRSAPTWIRPPPRSSALTAALGDKAGTELAAASVYAAADNFFNGHGQQVMRVDGPLYDSATGLIPATSANTVLWYTARTAPTRAPRSMPRWTTARPSGTACRPTRRACSLVQTLAAMAVETYPSGDPTSGGRFDAMASRQIANLAESNSNTGGSITSISVELALANTSMENAKARQTAHGAQLQLLLTDLETVPPEEVSMEILSLKTRLEASYETTSLIAQLSLVNYLR